MLVTSSSFSFSTYSTILLSCSANSAFSSSATSSIASFATYSTSDSLILISKSDLPNPGAGPGFIHHGQQLRSHCDQLPPPDSIWNVDYDSGHLDRRYGRSA